MRSELLLIAHLRGLDFTIRGARSLSYTRVDVGSSLSDAEMKKRTAIDRAYRRMAGWYSMQSTHAVTQGAAHDLG